MRDLKAEREAGGESLTNTKALRKEQNKVILLIIGACISAMTSSTPHMFVLVIESVSKKLSCLVLLTTILPFMSVSSNPS